jgi:hypothetical protein
MLIGSAQRIIRTSRLCWRALARGGGPSEVGMVWLVMLTGCDLYI